MTIQQPHCTDSCFTFLLLCDQHLNGQGSLHPNWQVLVSQQARLDGCHRTHQVALCAEVQLTEIAKDPASLSSEGKTLLNSDQQTDKPLPIFLYSNKDSLTHSMVTLVKCKRFLINIHCNKVAFLLILTSKCWTVAISRKHWYDIISEK